MYIVHSFFFIRIYFIRIYRGWNFRNFKNILRMNPRLRFKKGGYSFVYGKSVNTCAQLYYVFNLTYWQIFMLTTVRWTLSEIYIYNGMENRDELFLFSDWKRQKNKNILALAGKQHSYKKTSVASGNSTKPKKSEIWLQNNYGYKV